MSRWLGVHKATCQRVVEGVNKARDELECFSRFPGIDGLRNHLAACERRGVDPERVKAASAAVEEYQQFLDEANLTQRSLIAELTGFRGRSPEAQGEAEMAAAEQRRRALYDAARELTGEDIAVKAVVAVFAADPSGKPKMWVTVGSRQSGILHQGFARPIAPFQLANWKARFAPSKAPAPHGDERDQPYQVVERLTTASLRINTIDAAAGRTVLVAEAPSRPETGESMPVDIAILFDAIAQPHPDEQPERELNVAARITEPTRSLVLDVYVDSTLNIKATPGVQCVTLAAPPGDMPGVDAASLWHERLPEWPTVQQLGKRGVPASSSLHDRQHDLAVETLAAAGVEPGRCAVFRCEVRFPVWQSEYRLTIKPAGG